MCGAGREVSRPSRAGRGGAVVDSLLCFYNIMVEPSVTAKVFPRSLPFLKRGISCFLIPSLIRIGF